jgi:phenylpyruvate tautomerase PptA (4-oxalocrotonate tautomerase family)
LITEFDIRTQVEYVEYEIKTQESKMPLITLKTMQGKSPAAIRKTMDEISQIVSKNLDYDPSHVWVFVEETADEHFLTAGRTWAELKPMLYPDQGDR